MLLTILGRSNLFANESTVLREHWYENAARGRNWAKISQPRFTSSRCWDGLQDYFMSSAQLPCGKYAAKKVVLSLPSFASVFHSERRERRNLS